MMIPKKNDLKRKACTIQLVVVREFKGSRCAGRVTDSETGHFY